MGRVHLETLFYQHPEVSIAYVVSKDGISVVDEFPRLFEGRENPCIYLDQTEEEQVWTDASVGAVVICTPTKEHQSQVRRALETGKHVFCEKPLATNLDGTLQLLRLAKSKNLILFCAFQRRFDPSFAAVQAKLSSGQLGTIQVIKSTSRDPAVGFDLSCVGDLSIFLDSMIHNRCGVGNRWGS